MKPQFMLDTDMVSFALRGEGDVAERIRERSPSALCVSAITVAELRYGADLKGSKKIHHALDEFFAAVQVLPFDLPAAHQFGKVAAALDHDGTPIGAFDALIAAHAMARGTTLVTNNTRHFANVSGLRIDNWLKKAV